MDQTDVQGEPQKASVFPATHWTEIAAIANPDNPNATAALERLCQIYLPAIASHIRWLKILPGDPHELANEFLAQFIHGDALKRVDRSKGKFRNYLSGAIRHFLQDKRRSEAKTPEWVEWSEAVTETPDTARIDAEFDRHFANILVGNSLNRTIAHFRGSRVHPHVPFILKFLSAEPPAETVRAHAQRLGVDENLLYQHISRFRSELSRRLQTEVRRHLGPDDDVAEEMQALLRAYGR